MIGEPPPFWSVSRPPLMKSSGSATVEKDSIVRFCEVKHLFLIIIKSTPSQTIYSVFSFLKINRMPQEDLNISLTIEYSTYMYYIDVGYLILCLFPSILCISSVFFLKKDVVKMWCSLYTKS